MRSDGRPDNFCLRRYREEFSSWSIDTYTGESREVLTLRVQMIGLPKRTNTRSK